MASDPCAAEPDANPGFVYLIGDGDWNGTLHAIAGAWRRLRGVRRVRVVRAMAACAVAPPGGFEPPASGLEVRCSVL